jgi:hypothetical protein
VIADRRIDDRGRPCGSQEGMMTEFDVTKAQGIRTTPQRFACLLAETVRRFFAFGPTSRSACQSAWELAGLTRVDRFDIVPWMSI